MTILFKIFESGSSAEIDNARTAIMHHVCLLVLEESGINYAG